MRKKSDYLFHYIVALLLLIPIAQFYFVFFDRADGLDLGSRDLFPLAFAFIGLLLILLPAEFLLAWDRRTGYWIYERALERSNDEKNAIMVAGIFYKIFGGFILFFSLYVFWPK